MLRILILWLLATATFGAAEIWARHPCSGAHLVITADQDGQASIVGSDDEKKCFAIVDGLS